MILWIAHLGLEGRGISFFSGSYHLCNLLSNIWLRLPGLTNKDTGNKMKFEFHINKLVFLICNIWGILILNKLFLIYLKFKFNGTSCILPGNIISDPTSRWVWPLGARMLSMVWFHGVYTSFRHILNCILQEMKKKKAKITTKNKTCDSCSKRCHRSWFRVNIVLIKAEGSGA